MVLGMELTKLWNHNYYRVPEDVLRSNPEHGEWVGDSQGHSL